MRRLFLVLPLLLAIVPAAGAQSVLKDVQVHAGTEATTVEITLVGRARYVAEPIDRPARIVIDLADTVYAWTPSPHVVGGTHVKEIRGSQFRKDVARLVIELTRPTAYRIEPHAGGLRVVIAGSPVAPKPSGAPPSSSPPSSAVPPATAEAPKTELAPKAEPAPSGDGFRVQGIVVGDKEAVAYIEDPSSRRVEAYRVGQALAGGTIESITEDRVVVRRPAGSLELRVGEPSTSVPPARN